MINIRFINAAAKTLRAVEVDSSSSNQHEFNGVASLKRLFGYDRQILNATFCYISDEHQIDGIGSLTWYDARENDPDRSEYRLYFTEDNVVYNGEPGDLLVIGINERNQVQVLIIKKYSVAFRTISSLFGIYGEQNSYVVRENIML
ncbi:type II restriction endonuclease [Clostridioides sp. ES-S-0123-01]|uniref:hypothetical protein n=1 Tax=Clostridioides sp. ES-S-0123-01 TaxID=2770783 RepID=UPI001D110753|nr:type II restriction endonuclease [Clostridioides sp. ES-S-0123-01]